LTFVTKARASAYLQLAALTVSVQATTVGAVVGVVVFIVKRTQKDDGTASLEPGQLTRHLVDSGLIGVRGDFGMELGLLLESPSAFDQLTTEARAGKGAILSSLSQSTNIPTGSLAVYWMTAVDEVGVTVNKRDASHTVFAFLDHLSPDLEVSDQVLGEFTWRLVKERLSPSFPESATSHAWLAEWLGVPLDVVAVASQGAIDELILDGATARVQVLQHPRAFLDAIAISIEETHREDVEERVQGLIAEARSQFPAAAVFSVPG
jgi:hypothetical protein